MFLIDVFEKRLFGLALEIDGLALLMPSVIDTSKSVNLVQK